MKQSTSLSSFINTNRNTIYNDNDDYSNVRLKQTNFNKYFCGVLKITNVSVLINNLGISVNIPIIYLG
jgi:hypothetical protein